MNAVIEQRNDTGAIDIAWLADTVRRNRFMPIPPHDQVFVGDGDFRAIGAEFLRHSVELAGLKPTDRVADIGCGIGRLAVPLTQYLDPEVGSYDGLDPVLAGIEWCRAHITPAYPRFRFHHHDVRHPLYHPTGTLSAETASLPFGDGAFDFAAMISLVTHLTAAEVARSFAEASRVLAPGGTLMVTAFVMDRDGKRTAVDPRLQFARGNGPEWYADPAAPMSAVALDDGFIEATAEAAGLSVRRRFPGHWSGLPAAHFQDLFVIQKRANQ
jgi:SAM-dependent methyltransferase